jgi:hypothetical protein
MKYSSILLLIFLISNFITAQNIICSDSDQQAIAAKINEIRSLEQGDFGETLVLVGKTFLGMPYVAQTLEVGNVESLVINLQGLDCTTFVENVLAFTLIKTKGNATFDSFVNTLEEIRYRNGKLNGYASRLHYFSDWITENEKQGLVKDITVAIGGVKISKEINFMSTHRYSYPFLEDEENYLKIKRTEDALNQKSFYILHQDQIENNEHLINPGDIIALTTSISGLDITHTGIATREADGRIHLLHASSSGQVEISELPLTDYLKNIKNNTGIMVARPVGE